MAANTCEERGLLIGAGTWTELLTLAPICRVELPSFPRSSSWLLAKAQSMPVHPTGNPLEALADVGPEATCS